LENGKTTQNLTTVNLAQVAQQITQMEVPKNHLVRFEARATVLSAMGLVCVIFFTSLVLIPNVLLQHQAS